MAVSPFPELQGVARVQKSRIIRGRVLYVSETHLYLARGARLFVSSDGGKNFRLWATLPVGFWRRIAMSLPLLARLFRLGVHHLVFSGHRGVVVANKETYLIEKDFVVHLGTLHGSRPMALCAAKGGVYYGEYRSNPERSAVHVYAVDFTGCSWRAVWRFENVRHVHGVYFDPYADAFWVTTGDTDTEAAIWRSDDHFQTLRRVAGGSQQLRAVQLLFTPDYVYFGSDTPEEYNNIYRMDRSGSTVESLVSVGGSIFYGCQVDRSLFFSTAVEPSKVNPCTFSEVWRSDDGTNWQKSLEFKKDRLPMKYFQYGQVLFPLGDGNQKSLYCTPFATEFHEKTFVFPQAEA